MYRTATILIFTAAIALTAASAADAQVRFGLRVGEYTNVGEPMLGAELIMKFAPRWYFNPNIEYVFVENADLVTFNADVHYDFATNSKLLVWAGGGLAVVYENFVETDTNLGANILGGVGWRLGNVIPYAQAKALVGDREDFVVAAGIRF